MRIFVIFHCQSPGIQAALRLLLPDAEITGCNLGPLIKTGTSLADAAAEAAKCDHVVSMKVLREFGPLETDLLRPTLRKLHVLPPVNFGGFHPDMIEVRRVDNSVLPGISMGSHSRIALLGYLAGLSVTDTAGLYNRLSFRRLGYLSAFAEHSELMAGEFAGFGIDGEKLLQSWRRGGCFMHSPIHPVRRPLLDLARVACDMIGLTPAANIAESALPDFLAAFPRHPVFPDIAEVAGVAPQDGFWTASDKNGPARKLNADEFVAESYNAFAGIERAQLLIARGIAKGFEALRLTEAI